MSHRVAIVTGGSRGIGRAIVLALAERGWSLVVNYRGRHVEADRTAAQATTAGGKTLVIQADIAQAGDRDRLVRETLHRLGRIDLLVNNAGIAPRQRVDLLDTPEASFDEVMDVNLKGPFFLTQHVARTMIAQPAGPGGARGCIINVGSLSAYTASVSRPEYCLSKAGLGMLTMLYADRLAEFGIQVFEVRPGIIKTDMTSAVQAHYDRLIADGLTPIRRWGQPLDVARAVGSIADGAFPFSTGEVLHVDGGFHLRRL